MTNSETGQRALISPEAEYKALRDELIQAKGYVFERPIVIAALAVASTKFLEKPVLFVIPSLVAMVFLFNLWFSVNRLRSATRIVAYIQCVLEEKVVTWQGWETSLRHYRQ